MSIFRKKFKGDFNFHEFIIFDREIFDEYGLTEIRFHPNPPSDVFLEQHLTHISPTWRVDDPNGFVFVWKKYKDIIRKVSFDQFSIGSENRKIRMSIDFDDRSISLDMAEGVPILGIERALENSFGSNLLDEKNKEIEIDNAKERKSIGILNKGKGNSFINNSFLGLDVGIQDEGEKTYASGNEFLDRAPHIEKIEIIKGNKIEQHGGKNKAEMNKINKKEEWFSMQNPWVWLIFGTLLIIVGAVIKYYFPNFF